MTRLTHSPAPGGFPVDELLQEINVLSRMARHLENVAGDLHDPAMADVETADAPEHLDELVAWVNREIDVRTLALRDYQHGMDVTWPPEGPARVKRIRRVA